MKTNELRIGNYVMYADVICKVEGYSKGFLETNGVNSLISKFQPIPIDEKWLLKFGFKHSGNSFYIHCESLIQLCNIGDIYFNVGVKDIAIGKINYIHELQNLFFILRKEELQYKTC